MKHSTRPLAASSASPVVAVVARHYTSWRWRVALAGAVLILVIAGPQRAWGSDIDDAKAEAQSAGKAADEASEGLDKLRPVGRVKDTEDAYDQARQKNDGVKDNPQSTAEEKAAAENAEKEALKNADKVLKDHAEVDTGTGKAYREALDKRRKPLERLKKARARLAALVQANKQGGMGPEALEPYERALKEAIKAQKHAEPQSYSMVTPPPAGGTYAALIADHKIAMTVAGTGETLGKVASLTLTNLTDAALSVAVPALVLESANGRSQDYACPRGQTVELGPNAAKTVPLMGNCLVRAKPPVAEGGKGQLVARDADGTALNGADFPAGKTPPAHLATGHLGKLLRVAQSYDDAAEKLEKKGAFKDMPYSDPEMRKNIVKQWGPWMDPGIAKATGGKPATKEDLKKTVYKQAGEHTKLTKQTKEKLDDGIDALFKGIQLASKEAKNLEEPDPGGLPPGTGPTPVSDDAPKPATQEKTPTDDKPKDKADKPPATQEKKPKAKATPLEEARDNLEKAKKKYADALDKHWSKTKEKHPAIKELEDKLNQSSSTLETMKNMADLSDLYHKDKEEFDAIPEGGKLKKSVHDAEQDLYRLSDPETERKEQERKDKAEKERKDKVEKELKKLGVDPKPAPPDKDSAPPPPK